MQYEIINKENLEATLKITIEPKDYVKEFNKQVREIQAKGNFKGFRKGKTPASFVHKMYGKNFIAETVSKAIDKAFKEIVDSEKINYVAQPIPSSDTMIDPDYKNLNKSYEYSLDLGLVEDFEVKGLDETYEMFEVTTDQETVDQHLENISKTFGSMESVDDEIQMDDVLKVSATELQGVDAKKDGWLASFDIVMKSIKSDELKEELSKKKKGDKFVANINVVTNRPASSIRKDLLGVEEDDDREIGEMFEFVIEDVERLKPAELTDELIKEKMSTWNLDSVEHLIKDFKKNQSKSYEKDATNIMRRDIMNKMMDMTTVNMSESFLRRWLTESENVTTEKLDSQTEALMKELKWNQIKSKLMNAHNISIEKHEIDQKLEERAMLIMRQYGMYEPSLTPRLIEQLRSDKNELYNAVSSVESEKMFDAIMPNITVQMKEIGSKAFEDYIQEHYGSPEPEVDFTEEEE